jgi:phosphoglycolate phosphatase
MKLVILDCDGTIVDSQNGICEAMSYTFSRLGLAPPTRAQTLAVVGLSLAEAFAILAQGHDDAVLAQLAEQYRTAFRELKRDPAHHEPLFEGMASVIEQFSSREDLILGIATGKSRRGIDRLFEREGWAEYFHTIQTADDHPSKPNPAMIHAAMAETGVGPAKTVMVGDTTFDMEMAAGAGVAALGAGWGYHRPDELLASGALAIVETCSGLPAEVDAAFARQERVA